jgi:hypothetical protein
MSAMSGASGGIGCGLVRRRFTINRLSAPKYAFAEPTSVSGSAPLAVTVHQEELVPTKRFILA